MFLVMARRRSATFVSLAISAYFLPSVPSLLIAFAISIIPGAAFFLNGIVLQQSFYKKLSSVLLSAVERLGSTGSPWIFRVSLAHSPKSINLQRSEQKGLKPFSGCHVFCLPQVGQLTFGCLFMMVWVYYIRDWSMQYGALVLQHVGYCFKIYLSKMPFRPPPNLVVTDQLIKT